MAEQPLQTTVQIMYQ